MMNGHRPDFIGSGWAFPLRINGRGGIELSRGEQDVEEAIRLILATPLGERRMRPDFGCGVQDLTFATNDPTTHGQIVRDVRGALELWEPRIEVLDVRADLDPDADAQVRVEVDYVLRATNEMRNLVYPFYLIPGEE
jgi:phage baseplate assembly protein W